MTAQKIPPWTSLVLPVALVAGVFFALAFLGGIVSLVVVAALLAYLFEPVVNALEARGLGRTAATVLLFAGLTLAVAVFLFFVFPAVAAQARAIQEGFDAERVRAVVEDVEAMLEARLAVFGVGDLNVLGTLQTFVTRQLSEVVNYVPGALSLVSQLLIIPFVMFFLLKDSRRIKKGFVSLVPNRFFEFTLNVLYKTNVQLGNYLRGQAIASLVVAVLSIGALWLLDVDYFILIGLFAGLTNLIPYLGPVVGATVAALVSVVTTGSFDTVPLIVGAFILIQMIDNAGVQPMVLARNVKLHPLLILLTLLVAGKFFGLLGLLLAVPATAVLKVFAQETLRNLRNYRLA